MKIPYKLPCEKCGKEITTFIEAENTSIDFKCDCGITTSGSIALMIGSKIMARAIYEFLTMRDYSMTIVLAAMAFECEMSRLFKKWVRIGESKEGYFFDDKAVEVYLRRYSDIETKITEVSKLMFPTGMTEFIKSRSDLIDILKGFPSLSIDKIHTDFKEKLFWPRNAILHNGKSNYDEDYASRCLNYAKLGLVLLDQMDKHKRDSLI